jgi:HEAT repeat protein
MSEQARVIKQNGKGTNLESLMNMLESKDIVTREKARELLIVIGKPAVPSLIQSLQTSKLDHLRWEAAKILGSIDDKRAIPSLVKALEDDNRDVAWLAALALRNFGKTAWPQLLKMLIDGKSDSVLLRQGVHHVLRDQSEDGFDDLLANLIKALESDSVPESSAIAAYDLLERLNAKS